MVVGSSLVCCLLFLSGNTTDTTLGTRAELNISLRDYPTKFRFATYNVVAQSGATWFFVPAMITFFVVLTEIVAEKENRQRLGMRMMGLSNAPYWLSWWLYGVCFVTMSSVVLIATGYAFQFDIFWNSNPFCMLILFFAFGMAVTALSMFISTLVQKAGTAQTSMLHSFFSLLTCASWLQYHPRRFRVTGDPFRPICKFSLVRHGYEKKSEFL